MVDMAFIRLELSFPALFCVASFRITQAHGCGTESCSFPPAYR